MIKRNKLTLLGLKLNLRIPSRNNCFLCFRFQNCSGSSTALSFVLSAAPTPFAIERELVFGELLVSKSSEPRDFRLSGDEASSPSPGRAPFMYHATRLRITA